MKTYFKEFNIDEKTGVPVGIVDIANDCAKTVIDAMSKNIRTKYNRSIKYIVESYHPEFPVKDIEIVIKHEISIMDDMLLVGGHYDAESLKEDDNKITFDIHIDTTLDLVHSRETKRTDITDKLTTEIEGLFYHEFLHVYEDYHRIKRKKLNGMVYSKDFITASSSTSIINKNPNINRLVKQFLFAIYTSATFENRARVAQVYPLIKDVKNPRDREMLIKQSTQWAIAELLLDFNASGYYTAMLEAFDGDMVGVNNMIKKIQKAILENSVAITDSLLRSIENKEIDQKESMDAKKRIDYNMKSIAKNSNDDPVKFLKFWERIFHAEGAVAKRKLSKLTTI